MNTMIRWTALCLLAVGSLATGACANSNAQEGPGAEESAEGAAPEEKAAPVEIAVLAPGPMEAVLRFSADLEAERAVPVAAQATRRVTRLLVEEGHTVTRGQLLATLEDDAQRVAVARMESQLAKVRSDHARQKSLFEQQLVSEQTFVAIDHQLEQLSLDLADARRELSYTEVRAPIAGTVTSRKVNVGDQVTMNQELFGLVDFGSLVVRVYVPEKDMVRVAPGQRARLSSPALPSGAFTAVVDRVAPVVDPRTGTVKVSLAVPYANGLKPGMFLDVQLVTAVREDALRVPKRALVLDDEDVYVFRVTSDNTVERLQVRPVIEDATAVEVADGLAAGDRLVVAGQAAIKAGDEVRVVGERDDA